VSKVFIANFGRQNYLWPECLARSTIATMNREATHPYWESGDRDGFVAYHLAQAKTAGGAPITKQIASRWFNLMTIVAETENDIWIHREKDQLWWTRSLPAHSAIEPGIDPTIAGNQRVSVCHKPCEPWSDRTASGVQMAWNTLHPKAKEFLFTEGTLQQLSEDYADYALAVIDGESLAPWHDRPEWKKKRAAAKTAPVTSFTAVRRSAVRMAMQAFGTAAQSNGQEVIRTMKDKKVLFTQSELEAYLIALMEAQEGLCALTELPLQYDGQNDDVELLPSLDRIDSDGHYEAGNLQVVCRFANRWKNNDKDENFKRLVAVVRGRAAASA
jgi:hypothetical protein